MVWRRISKLSNVVAWRFAIAWEQTVEHICQLEDRRSKFAKKRQIPRGIESKQKSKTGKNVANKKKSRAVSHRKWSRVVSHLFQSCPDSVDLNSSQETIQNP